LNSPPSIPATGADVDLLKQFLTNQDPEHSQALLTRLVREVAEPAVKRIVRWRLASTNEDVCHDALADLICRLREWKQSGDGTGIRDFSAYAAAAARNHCDEHLRQRFPQRYRLQKRLRYLLTRDPRFALWEDTHGDWISGRAKWRPRLPVPEAKPSQFRWESSLEAGSLVEEIFRETGSPVPFEDLVDRAAHRWGIFDDVKSMEREPADLHAGIESAMQNRAWLKRLWTEVVDLPVRQRVALLLNLRDDQGGSALALLPLTGVATVRQIAAALEMTPEALARIWKELPWQDQHVAQVLNLTAPQVANLRKSARERLSRRLA
jgi:RNA polymerase sigma factor (sigma-70 family)